MNTPYKQVTAGKCKFYDHRTNVRKARQLQYWFKELNFDTQSIIDLPKNNLGTLLTKFGGLLLERDRKNKDDDGVFADGYGKALAELFMEAYINSGRYERFTGISDYIPGFVLGLPDHGVEGQVTIKFPKPHKGTAQCKFTLNHYGDRTMIERNKHKSGNFYEQSVEDYGLDAEPIKTRKRYMVFFGNFRTNHPNTDGYNFVLRDQLELVDGDKQFWQEFFDCLKKLAATNIKQRSSNKITLYPSQIEDVSKLKNVSGQDNSSCGGGKSVKMHHLQEEALCK